MPSRKPAAQSASSDWMSCVRVSWHDVFLAGLASLARARRPGAQRGKTDFDTLVAEGRKLEPEMKKALRKTWDEWRERSWPPLALDPEGKLQKVFEERVGSVLIRLGVPSRQELADLNAKVDKLLGMPRAPATPRAAAKKKSARRAGKTARRSTAKAAAEQ